jgi:protein-S-isoprenylcysteine O-methyltransferase Ste14
MNDLNKKAIGGLLRLVATLGALLFVPVRTLDYWQAWVFLALFSVAILAITLYLMKKDPKLLERRVNAGIRAEKEKSQKIIQVLATITFMAVLAFPAFDHRFCWSAAPPCVAAAGDVLVVLGLLIVFLVFKENTYTAGVITVEAGQKVMSTGPYALVRHPMYAGALVMLLGVPLALGSWWGLLTFIPITIVIVWRLLEEEKFLLENLPGYSEYRNRVRHRLVPFIW